MTSALDVCILPPTMAWMGGGGVPWTFSSKNSRNCLMSEIATSPFTMYFPSSPHSLVTVGRNSSKLFPAHRWFAADAEPDSDCSAVVTASSVASIFSPLAAAILFAEADGQVMVASGALVSTVSGVTVVSAVFGGSGAFSHAPSWVSEAAAKISRIFWFMVLLPVAATAQRP